MLIQILATPDDLLLNNPEDIKKYGKFYEVELDFGKKHWREDIRYLSSQMINHLEIIKDDYLERTGQ